MKIKLILLLFALVFLAVGAEAANQFFGSTAYSNPSLYQPSFDTLYSGGEYIGFQTLWPSLSGSEMCDARQDLMLKIPNGGCQPVVVRSDLLAEQNVPVFCQIEAIKINPLVDITKIRNLAFTSNYPPAVSGTGFHPANVALRTQDRLLGSPVTSNIGYAVVILKKNENESSLPSSVNVNLTARIEYETDNSWGVGRAEFILAPENDESWEKNKDKQSFWGGRYFLRLINAEANFADLAVYQGDRLIANYRVNKGEISKPMYVPGGYCRVGFQTQYSGFEQAKNKARLEIVEGNSIDTIDVYEGSLLFSDSAGNCRVEKININNRTGIETGNVTIRCGSGGLLFLELKTKFESFKNKEPKVDASGMISIEFSDGSKYGLDKFNNFLVFKNGKWEEQNVESILDPEKKITLTELKLELSAYKKLTSKDSGSAAEPVSESDKTFANAIAAYEKVADDYSYESEPATDKFTYYGEEALAEAIQLAEDNSKTDVEARLLNKLIKLYPNSGDLEFYKGKLRKLVVIDSSKAENLVYLNNKYRTIRLVSLSAPVKKSSARLIIENSALDLEVEQRKDVTYIKNNDHTNTNIGVRLEKVDVNKAYVNVYCPNDRAGIGAPVELLIGESGKQVCNGVMIKLDSVNLEKIAKVSLTPYTSGTSSIVNLSVNIEIEKRAIQLSPEKTKEKILNLNKTIQKWESITNSLGKVVSGLKGACLATGAVLTVKNFMAGLSGEGIARQQVMRGDNGWATRCKVLVEKKQYSTLDACYLAKSNEINSEVNLYESAMNKVNSDIKSTEELNKNYNGFLGEQSVNRDASVPKYAELLKKNYGNEEIELENGRKVQVSELLNNSEGYNNGEYSYEQLREMETSLLVRKAGKEQNLGNVSLSANNELKKIGEQITSNQELIKENQRSLRFGNKAMSLSEKGQKTIEGDVFSINKLKQGTADQLKSGDGSKITKSVYIDVKKGSSGFEGTYVAGLEQSINGDYGIKKVVKIDDSGNPVGGALSDAETVKFIKNYNLGPIVPTSPVSYNNKYLNPEVRYFETEPYKGMPALAPLDLQNGWYVATRQTLPLIGAGSSKGAFDSSGRVASFWLCNVGKNGIEQFEEGVVDDTCEQINTYTGQAISFPGLDEKQAKSLADKATKALQDAANQYGQKVVVINGQRISNVKVASNVPATQCQDFMTPEDCYLLFNVCDPVICPATRCNLGGNYHVADVIQSGIIGSSLLCLPNIKEGIYIPVCLSGINAGLEGYLSILKSYRDCLQESVKSGKTVGICDQVNSIYMCEFIWRQAAPVAKAILPKLIEMAYGKTTARGGGEYLTVQNAWANAQKSIDYFKNTYAVNAFKAFQIRSVEEAGTPFCKAFISAKAPTEFKSLIEPDSPPQFHGYFSAIKFTDATIPPTDQYKVFYHIYSGKDSGVSFRVYLKNPSESSYYSTPVEWIVASGFVAQGDYKTETKDFTAPSGYKELCISVNGEVECGFKQVSSSFAVDYLRDEYVASEITKNDISSEKTCISGGANAGSLLSNTNPQTAVEEFAFSQDYNRGIVRICATDNPGLSTDPMRFQEVGYCDDPKMKCWLDKQSVKNAISTGNIGVKNATLSQLENEQMLVLEQQGKIISVQDADAKLHDFKDRAAALMNIKSASDSRIVQLISEMNDVYPKLFLNSQKAEFLLIKGRVFATVMKTYKIESSGSLISSGAAAAPSAGSSAAGTSSNTNQLNTDSAVKKVTLKDSAGGYTFGKRYYILIDKQETGYYIEGAKVVIDNEKLNIGVVKENNITLLQSYRPSLGDDFDLINGTKITQLSPIEDYSLVKISSIIFNN